MWSAELKVIFNFFHTTTLYISFGPIQGWHKFQLKFTILRPIGRACIHNEVKISHGKSLTMCPFFVHQIIKI